MKSKEIKYEVLFNKRKKLLITINKQDLLQDYKHYIGIRNSIGITKNINLRKYVLARLQEIIQSTFIEY